MRQNLGFVGVTGSALALLVASVVIGGQPSAGIHREARSAVRAEPVNGDGITDCNANGVDDTIETEIVFEELPIADSGVVSDIADVDGDADEDVILEVDGDVAWYENTDGMGTFVLGGVLGVSHSVLVAAGDFDGDGDADVVRTTTTLDESSQRYTGEVVVHLNTDGQFDAGVTIVTFEVPGGIRWNDLLPIDVSGDGALDIVTAHQLGVDSHWYQPKLSTIINSGTGSFVPVQEMNFGSEYTVPFGGNLAAGDMDADGDVDLVYAPTGPAHDETKWFENTDGAGTFSYHSQFGDSGTNYGDVALGDVDGDGLDDLVVAHVESASEGGIFWRENLGGLNALGPEQEIASGPQWQASTVDLDGDGDLDILGNGDPGLGWLENTDGAGTFGPLRMISDTTGRALTADIDGNHTTDIVTSLDGAVIWFRNGSGDCNGNRVPDECDVDCDANLVVDVCEVREMPGIDCNTNLSPDRCDIASGTSGDCTANGIPDECETDCDGDGTADACATSCVEACDLDGDGCLNEADLFPMDAGACGDTEGDSCDDCSGGIFDPANDGENGDPDGVCDAGDCDPLDFRVWSDPGGIRDLRLDGDGSTVTLNWLAPEVPGATSVRYDTVRSSSASDFVSPGIADCVETDETDRVAADTGPIGPGEVSFYLIRVENDCPGSQGNLGTDHAGVSRQALGCGSCNDQDEDDLCAADDNCPIHFNPSQSDSDNDQIGDPCDECPVDPLNDEDGDLFCANLDNCPTDPNPGQEDVDSDGIGDACDACWDGTDPDLDQLCAAVDNCPQAWNPGQEDLDGDSHGDVCDSCPTDPNPGQEDMDGDGVGDVCDNCPAQFNGGQQDEDGDGLGDACDYCLGDPVLDGDTICTDVDNCPYVSNPGQQDADGDSHGDACDNCPSVSGNQTDSDQDGSGDVCDPCPLDADDDVDADGVCGDVDNCVTVHNPDQADSDIGDVQQWGVDAFASSEWSPDNSSAMQAAGPPESVMTCADRVTNWSPLGGGPEPEWLEVEYAVPVRALGANVHESLESGFVYQVDVRDTSGTLHTVWSGVDSTACGAAFEVTWPETTFDVVAVRVHTQVDQWEEIDAVELVGRGPLADGVGDVCDLCPGVFDPDQQDSDGDLIGDACDPD